MAAKSSDKTKSKNGVIGTAGHTLRSYKRVHKFDHPTDVEQGKVSRDTAASIGAAKESKRLGQRVLSDPTDEDLLEQYDEAAHAAEKKRRDAKTHKNRLKQLKKEGLK